MESKNKIHMCIHEKRTNARIGNYASSPVQTYKLNEECNGYSSEDEDFQLFLKERYKKQKMFKVYDKAVKTILKQVKNTAHIEFKREKIERVTDETDDEEAFDDINLILKNEKYNIFSKKNSQEKLKEKKTKKTISESHSPNISKGTVSEIHNKWTQLRKKENERKTYEEPKEMTRNLKSGLCNELNNYFIEIFGNVKNVEALNEPIYEDGTLEEYLFYENKKQNSDFQLDTNDSHYLNTDRLLESSNANEEIKYLSRDNYHNTNQNNINEHRKNLVQSNHSNEEYTKKECKSNKRKYSNDKRYNTTSSHLGYNFSIVTTDIVNRKNLKNENHTKQMNNIKKNPHYTSYSQGKRIHTTADRNVKCSVYECNPENYKKRKYTKDRPTNEINTNRNVEYTPLNAFKNNKEQNDNCSYYIENSDRNHYVEINKNNNTDVQNEDETNYTKNHRTNNKRIQKEEEEKKEEEFSFFDFKKNSNNREIKHKLIY